MMTESTPPDALRDRDTKEKDAEAAPEVAYGPRWGISCRASQCCSSPASLVAMLRVANSRVTMSCVGMRYRSVMLHP